MTAGSAILCKNDHRGRHLLLPMTMRRMRRSLMIVLAAAACGGQPRANVPIPSGPYYDLPANDAELGPIAVGAAKALRPTIDGRFGGIVIGGQRLTTLSDSVARAIGAAAAVGSVTFTVFRGGSDVAFVGALAPSAGRRDGGLCITLVRSDTVWQWVERRGVVSPEVCRPT